MSQLNDVLLNPIHSDEVDYKFPIVNYNIKNNWKFITNQMNMAYMLGSGLIMPPSGFGNKYYQDTLSLVPGWIPVFPNNLSLDALEYSIQEQPKILNSCYVELDLSLIKTRAWSYVKNKWQEISFPDDIDGTEELLLLPAPLPINLIKNSIVFAEREHAKSFELSLKDYNNAGLTCFKTSTKKPEFNKKKTLPWPIQVSDATRLKPLEVDLTAVNAIGGAISALAIFSQKNAVSKAAYQDVAGRLDVVSYNEAPLKILNSIASWAHEPTLNGTDKDTFALLVQRIYEHIGSSDYGSALDIILANFIDISDLVYGGHKNTSKSAHELVELIANNARSPEDTLENLLEKYDKPLQQVLLSFVFRESLSSLWEYPLPIQPERIADVVLLAGLREGWMNLSYSLKQQQRCDIFVPHVMAMLAHRFSKSGMVLPKVEAPLLLSEHFHGEEWSKKQQDAAAHLARKFKWNCVSTRISLGWGDYHLKVGSSGVDILLDGEVKAVRTVVNKDKFNILLNELHILEPKLDAEIRKILGENL